MPERDVRLRTLSRSRYHAATVTCAALEVLRRAEATVAAAITASYLINRR